MLGCCYLKGQWLNFEISCHRGEGRKLVDWDDEETGLWQGRVWQQRSRGEQDVLDCRVIQVQPVQNLQKNSFVTVSYQTLPDDRQLLKSSRASKSTLSIQSSVDGIKCV